MDSTAIKRIEELAVASSSHDLTKEHIPAIVVPSGIEIKTLEHLLETPSHQRATYSTERLEDFTRYISSETLGDNKTAVFIKPDGSGAEGIIDYGSHIAPQWGYHRAKLTMRYTPEFEALHKACQKDLSQRDLIDYLEDWQNIIIPHQSEDEALTVSVAIQRIQRIDIHARATKSNTVGDFKSEGSVLEQIEARSGENAPPALLTIKLQVYPCTKSRSVRARISLKTGSEKPVFRLRITAEDALYKDVADEIDLEINTRLKDKSIALYIGEISKR